MGYGLIVNLELFATYILFARAIKIARLRPAVIVIISLYYLTFNADITQHLFMKWRENWLKLILGNF